MLNLLKLEKIDKEQVKKVVCELIDRMNNHEFKKIKKVLNKAGALDNVVCE